MITHMQQWDIVLQILTANIPVGVLSSHLSGVFVSILSCLTSRSYFDARNNNCNLKAKLGNVTNVTKKIPYSRINNSIRSTMKYYSTKVQQHALKHKPYDVWDIRQCGPHPQKSLEYISLFLKLLIPGSKHSVNFIQSKQSLCKQKQR